MRFSIFTKLAGVTLLASSIAAVAATPPLEQRAAVLARAPEPTSVAAIAQVAPEPRATRHRTSGNKKKKKHTTTSKKRKATTSTKKKHKTTSTKKHKTTSTQKPKTTSTKTTTTAKPTSTKVVRQPYVGVPGYQACRSGNYDFRTIKKNAFVEYGDEVNTPKGQAADWINLTGTKDAYKLTEKGLEISLLGPQNPIRTYSSAIQSTFTLQPGVKVTFNFKGVQAKGIATSACMFNGPGSNEIDIEFPQGFYETNFFKKVPGQDWTENARGSMFHSNTIQPWQTADRVHAHSFIWTREYIQFAMDGVVTNTRLRRDFNSGFPVESSPLNFGIWEPKEAGTIWWANGPADWTNLPQNRTAIFESITVDCNFTGPDALP